MTSNQLLDKKTIAELTARMYLDTGAVRFMSDKPFIFTSGWARPGLQRFSLADVVSRRALDPDGLCGSLDRDATSGAKDRCCGRWRNLPEFRSPPGWLIGCTCRCNTYARKRRGFGRGARDRRPTASRPARASGREISPPTAKARSTSSTRYARPAGNCDHCFVIFFYDIYPQGKKILGDLGVTLHALATWRDVLAVAKASGKFESKMLAEVEKFIGDPAGWSEGARWSS